MKKPSLAPVLLCLIVVWGKSGKCNPQTGGPHQGAVNREGPPYIEGASSIDSTLTKFSFLQPRRIQDSTRNSPNQQAHVPNVHQQQTGKHPFANDQQEHDYNPAPSGQRQGEESYLTDPNYEDGYHDQHYYDDEYYSETGPANHSTDYRHLDLFPSRDQPNPESKKESNQDSGKSPVAEDASIANSPAVRPGNLAALLAGADSISSTKSDTPSAPKRTVQSSSSSSSVPVIEKEYYDALYDEFLDMYYDPTAPKKNSTNVVQETKISPEISSNTKYILHYTETARPINIDIKPTTEREEIIVATTKQSTTTTSTSTLPPTTKPTTALTTTSTTKKPRVNPQSSISLSEILQELGVNLPQFIVALKKTGNSMKAFNSIMETRGLSRIEVKRANRSTERFFELLEEDFKLIATTGNSTVEISSTDKTVLENKSETVSFGARPSGVDLVKSKQFENDQESNKKTIRKGPIELKLEKMDITTVRPSRLTTVPLKISRREPQKPRAYKPRGYDKFMLESRRGLINSRLASTQRPTLRPPYVPKPPKKHHPDSIRESTHASFGETIIVDKINKKEESNEASSNRRDHFQTFDNDFTKTRITDSAEDINIATRSAILAASTLGGVALSVFIAIFVVVKYKSHKHKNRRRSHINLRSDSSSSSSPSLPPIYSSRMALSKASNVKETYAAPGFWDNLKKKFDPYDIDAPSTSSGNDPYYYDSKW